MKKYCNQVMISIVTLALTMTNKVFAQAGGPSFVNQNITNAPKLPGKPANLSFENGATGLKTGIDKVIASVSNVIDWILGLLAIISVIIIIFYGVKMLFNAGDDKATEEGFKVIKNIFIALLFIGAAWLIVQFIFFIVSLFVGT